MIVDKSRELNLSAKLYVLYNPYEPIADGYYSTSSTVQDPENTNPINRNTTQDKFKTIGGKKYNMKPSFFSSIPNLMNGHIPPVNTEIGAPRCTFTYGSLVPGEVHPVYNLLKGPIEKYNPNFIAPDLNISNDTGSAGTGASAGLGITQKTVDRGVPLIPYTLSNYFGSSNVLTTYNIWGLIDYGTGNLLTSDCKKYEGQITKSSNNKDAPLLTSKIDKNG